MRAVVDLYNRRRLADAASLAERLAEEFPEHPFGWKALGATLRDLGRLPEATRALREATRLSGDAESHNNLGLVLQEAGEREQAEAAFVEALRRQPGLVEAHANLGRLYHATGRLALAEASLRTALRIQPRLAEAHNSLAVVMKDSGRLLEAEASCRRAIACRPEYVEAHACHGAVLTSMGRLSDAEASFRRALQLRPDYLEAHSNLLFSHNYAADRSPQECLAEARQYGEKVSARAQGRYSTWLAAPEPQQLRVGVVSGDLREHPVGYFLDGLLQRLDRSRLNLYAYPTQHAGDSLTERIRSHCVGWTPLSGRGDADAARLIHADGIHVLFDLAGHSAHNRLPVFAYKPAPVQVSWLGYFATTGVAEIDYLLADPVSVPPAHHGHFSETIWYLPDTRMCFTPPAAEVPVAPLPALAHGFVTFGSFQSMAKLNDAVLALWAQVLLALPSARLRLQNRQLADAALRQQLGQRLQALGIAAHRVSMHGPLPHQAYLAAHGEVDLILDTFPFPGGTTTCEALWMGVPTLTLAGDRLIGRQGAGLLTAAGLCDWIAETPAHCVEKALAFATNLPALAGLRAGLRAQALASPLFDATRFARSFESAVWAMWQRLPGGAG